MSIVYIHAEVSFLSSRSPLFIVNGLKYEENAHSATLLACFSKYEINKICILLYIICYHTLFHYLHVNVASVISASKFRTSAMLLLLNVRELKGKDTDVSSNAVKLCR